MFGKILVGLDCGETCDAIFKKAVLLARSTSADMILLSVISPLDVNSPPILASNNKSYYPSNSDQRIWNVYQDVHREYGERELERLKNFSERAQMAGINTEFVQMSGSPGRAICDQAKACKADLIMVGSHGRKGLSEMILGSVSNYVTHHASCSVLVIHESAEGLE